MKKALIYGLSLALVLALSACAQPQEDTISQEQKELINNEETVADPLSDTEKAPATDEQEPYIVSLDDLPLDLLGAFEYGYSTVHTEYPDLSPEEQIEMELEVVDQWCTDYEIKLPLNLLDLYQSWHAQYEAALNAIDEGGNTQSGSNTGTQSGTVEDITPPTNNSNSSGGNTGNTSKPSTGSSNNSSGTSSGSSSSGSNNSNEFTPPSDADLEAAFGVPPVEMDPNSHESVGDGSGTYLDPEDLKPDGTQGTISW